MAAKLLLLCLLSTWVLMASADQQSPAPSPATLDCTNVIYDMTACLTYVTNGSNETLPDAGCCAGAASAVQVSPHCLCAALKEASDMGFAVNMTRSLELSSVCSLPVPKLATCDALSPPAPAPAPVVPSPEPSLAPVIPSPELSPPPKSAPEPSPPPESSPSPSPPPASFPSPPAPATVSPPRTPRSPVEPPVGNPEQTEPSNSMAMDLSSSVVILLVGLAVAIVAYLEM